MTGVWDGGDELLPKGEVIQDQVFSGSKGGENQAQEMTKHRNHGIESYRIVRAVSVLND